MSNSNGGPLQPSNPNTNLVNNLEGNEKTQIDSDLEAYLQNNFDTVFHLYREVMLSWSTLPNSSTKNRLIGHTYRQLFSQIRPKNQHFWELLAIEFIFQNFGPEIENAFTLEKALDQKFNFQKHPNLAPEHHIRKVEADPKVRHWAKKHLQ